MSAIRVYHLHSRRLADGCMGVGVYGHPCDHLVGCCQDKLRFIVDITVWGGTRSPIVARSESLVVAQVFAHTFRTDGTLTSDFLFATE